MDFVATIEHAKAIPQSKGRVTYRVLKRKFALDDESVEDLKNELTEAERVAYDENGRVLVWTGNQTPEEMVAQTPETPTGERRHRSGSLGSSKGKQPNEELLA